MEIDPEMMELTNKFIKAALLNMLYMFRQVEEMVNIMEREMEDTKRTPGFFKHLSAFG